jgi:outer membrane protein insertion porin family
MRRSICLTLTAALLASFGLQAQTTPPAGQQPQKPRPGAILDSSGSGRIVSAPAPPSASTTPVVDGVLAGRRIERFEAVGNTSVASDTIRVYLGINPGDAYDQQAIQKNFLNLWQTGLFDDIRIEAEPGDTGVVVRAIVKERPRIGAVDYRGNKELTAAKITEALEKEKIDLHVGNTIEQTLIRRAAEAIKKAYTEGGYEGVTVDSTIEDMVEPGERKVVFTINEGIKAKVADIDFTGNKHFTDRRLRLVMKEVKTHNLVTWIRKKDLYIPSKLDEDLENLKNFYQDSGYMDVSFGDPQVTTIRAGKKPRVKLVIPIKEGEIHKFGDVTVTGNTVFTSDQIIGNWPLQKGETIRRKPIATRLDSFGDAYRMRGYIYAYVTPEYVTRDGNITDVHVQVYEGDQFRLGRLEFEGNSVTKDKVLRREIFLDEGEIMDMETFKQSVYKLGQLGYFKVTENPDFKVNQEKKAVDITVKGTEEGKNDIQFGGGYSEGGGFFVQSQFNTRNFLGEGETFGLSFQRGSRTNYFTLSYADPWFFDTPNSLGISIFNRDTVYPLSVGFEERARGGTIAYGYRLHRFDSFSFIYGLERSRQHVEFSITPDENGNVPVADILDSTYLVSSVGPSYHYDSRDNPYDTTRGAKINMGITYSGGPLGGNIHLLKPSAGITKFFHLTRLASISINAEAGLIVPLDKNCAHTYVESSEKSLQLCVPQSDRYFVGGEYSVRGYRFGDLGPHETIQGNVVNSGGYKYNTFNAEYILKLSEPLRLVFFGDAGYSYGYRDKWDFSKLQYSTGAELRVFLPVFQFPLRFIYAISPNKQPGDHFESFQFTIGNTY